MNVINEATKSALKPFVGTQPIDLMQKALEIFLDRTPNGGSTRLFLEMLHLKADTIEIVTSERPSNEGSNHSGGYDITLTCVPIEGSR